MRGMDRVYMHVTPVMRQRLCDVLKELWNDTVVQRYAVSAHSAVHLLDRTLAACKSASSRDLATRRASRLHADGLEPHLTCGAPLRNRTVDLLLTIDIRGHSDQA
jgi:hypothetical protein